MDDRKQKAASLLRKFKGDNFIFGLGCFERLGELVAPFGSRVAVVTSGVGKEWGAPIHEATRRALDAAGLSITGDAIKGALPNSPREDVFRVAEALAEIEPDVVLAVGGGSCIDATKASIAYYVLGDLYPEFDEYFGVGCVAEMLSASGRRLVPLVAAQLASGSGAHLTRYSNITDMATAQKTLIIDDAVTPPKAMFDYAMTTTMSKDFTMDGALDGVSHCLEVLYGAREDTVEKATEVSLLGIDLVISSLKTACDEPDNLSARESLGLGTDLGGYAIMIGGTNGAHLNSFSLVDLMPHGRACALMEPYYTVFFAPAIEERLRGVGDIYARAGYTSADLGRLHGRDLGLAVAEAMLGFSRDLGFVTTLDEVDGFTDARVESVLAAAKNPKLESKLKNMPVALSAETVDEYMGSVLAAARTGDFGLIKNMP
jgi:alcohol dehydrogenase